MESGRSPRISLRAMQYTCAGAQSFANLPPFTAERCLRMVLISTISAPHFKSWSVMSRKSARVSSPAGHSKSAEPPPETRKNTVSFSVKPETAPMIFCVPRIVFSSGRGCPASRMVKPGISPFAWSYFVRTMPASILWGIFSAAAFAMFQAALPMAMTIPLPSKAKVLPPMNFFTASSGRDV